MYIAEKLRKENVVEYLLYMCQVEDVVRAYGVDAERIGNEYVPKFGLEGERLEELRGWYERMAEMMREENVVEKGHLQINKNVVILLTDLHVGLLRSSKHPRYGAAYYRALPLIVELRARNGKGAENEGEKGEIENCLEALYGVMLLRMQGKPVSEETERAVACIAEFVGMLGAYYEKEKRGELEL